MAQLNHEEIFPAVTSSLMQGLKSLGIFKPGIIIKISEEAGKNLAKIVGNVEKDAVADILAMIVGIPRDAWGRRK